MRSYVLLALASVSGLALASTATAQTAAAPAAQPAEAATLGEVVVTARRRSESLQEVPQTVNAVTSDTLQKLNIRQFADIQAVAPGLNLKQSSTGFQNTASLRGVSYDVNTGAQIATVATYLNDAPLQLGQVFQSLFDIGQVEILKGPQGTTRGVSAPSGAITLTTHKPDLSEFGGYGDVTATDQHGRNVQGAINVPIIKDVLAARFAGVLDTNQGDGVRSIHNAIRPRSRTDGFRASVSFEPTDLFNANVVYQHFDQDLVNFRQVTGPGPGDVTNPAGTFPASINPPLTAEQRVGVQDAANHTRNHYDVVIAQLDSRIFGQHLSYVGSYSHQKIDDMDESDDPSFGDVGNLLPGVAILHHARTQSTNTTQEIRLASDPAPGRFIDYTVGAFYSWQDVTGLINQPGPLLPGAFGPPPGVDLALYNSAYSLPIFIDIPRQTQETSLFGSVTLHLGPQTELSGGIRHLWALDNNHTILTLGSGKAAVPASLFGGNCAALNLTSTYPGFCDFVIPAGEPGGIGNFAHRASDTPNIYNVSLSHHFTRDFLAYVNTGTSYRGGTVSVGLQGDIVGNPDPALNGLTNHPAERSRSYEIGFKSTWLDGRARLNAAMFRQRFHNLAIYIPNIEYFSTVSNAVTSFSFTAPVDALVQGFDVDGAFQVTPEWSVSAQLSYADGAVQGSMVPCNADKPLSRTNLVNLCPGGSSSRLPYWNMTLQSEYTHPVQDNMDGFIRVLATIYPENRNRVEPDFTVPNYSLLNLYAGVRSHDGAWEASIFARNLLNTTPTLDRSPVEAELNTTLGTSFSSLIHPSGYFETQTQTPREIGVSVHYAWGAR